MDFFLQDTLRHTCQKVQSKSVLYFNLKRFTNRTLRGPYPCGVNQGLTVFR